MNSKAVDMTGRMNVGQFRRLFPNQEAYPNPSGLKPLGVAVLVEPYDSEVKTTLIEIPATVAERMMRAAAPRTASTSSVGLSESCTSSS